MKYCALFLFFSITITAMNENLKFNNASPNPPHKSQPVGWYSYNDTHLTMRYVPSPGKPVKSVTIPWNAAQRKLFLKISKDHHFYSHVYVQGNTTWFALPKNKEDL